MTPLIPYYHNFISCWLPSVLTVYLSGSTGTLVSLEYTVWRLHWFPSVISVSHGGSTGTIAIILYSYLYWHNWKELTSWLSACAISLYTALIFGSFYACCFRRLHFYPSVITYYIGGSIGALVTLEYIFSRLLWLSSVVRVSHNCSSGTMASIQLFIVAPLVH